MGTNLRAAVLVTALGLLAVTTTASAQVVPKCTAAKLKYEGKAAAKVIKCYARAAGKQEAVDIECVQKALIKLDESFAKAQADGPCHDGSAFRALLVTEVEAGVTAALYPAGLLTDAQFECASAKLKASAKLASKTANCHAKAAKKATAVDPICLQKAAAKFTDGFVEAETVGGCATNGNASTVAAYTKQFVDSTVVLLTADLPADQAPIRCCAASAALPVGTVTGCADLVLGRCTTAAVLLSSVGGTAVQGAPGNVCNGATGACAAARTGISTCCEASKNGLQICAEGPILGGSGFPPIPSCSFYNGQGGVTFTQHNGKICKDDLYPTAPPHCAP
jgi:hypothetical protein